MNGICSINGCVASVHCKALCKRHYERHRLKLPTRKGKTLEELLLERRVMNHSTGCWEYIGSVTKSRYPRLAYKCIRHKVHRWSAFIYLGFDITSDLLVLHTCDNTKCFNPSHLFIGTQDDNMRDAAKKGRLSKMFGEVNPNARISMKDAMAIRMAKLYGISRKAVAKEYGITVSHVSQIWSRRSWRHLPDPT